MSDILDAFKVSGRGECPLPTEDGRRMRVGIIGCGGIAFHHIKAYLDMPDVDIVAACDLVPGRAAELLSRFGICAKTDYRDHNEMLDDAETKMWGVNIKRGKFGDHLESVSFVVKIEPGEEHIARRLAK